MLQDPSSEGVCAVAQHLHACSGLLCAEITRGIWQSGAESISQAMQVTIIMFTLRCKKIAVGALCQLVHAVSWGSKN